MFICWMSHCLNIRPINFNKFKTQSHQEYPFIQLPFLLSFFHDRYEGFSITIKEDHKVLQEFQRKMMTIMAWKTWRRHLLKVDQSTYQSLRIAVPEKGYFERLFLCIGAFLVKVWNGFLFWLKKNLHIKTKQNEISYKLRAKISAFVLHP